jgi:hypothetical protein
MESSEIIGKDKAEFCLNHWEKLEQVGQLWKRLYNKISTKSVNGKIIINNTAFDNFIKIKYKLLKLKIKLIFDK